MSYENLNLVVAGLSGEIYLTRMLKSGFMGESRRIATEDCLRATTEWFMANNKKMIRYNSLKENETPTLFFTKDAEKAKRILDVLQEDV